MEQKMELTCIRCPMGCRMTATVENGSVTAVTGNTCRRGKEYAMTEAVAPVRTVTSTVLCLGGVRPVVAVKTVPEVPKARVFDVMDVIRRIRVKAPVHIGDVLLRDAAGTGADIVATAELDKK
jgi:CxxC motif-containing protein